MTFNGKTITFDEEIRGYSKRQVDDLIGTLNANYESLGKEYGDVKNELQDIKNELQEENLNLRIEVKKLKSQAEKRGGVDASAVGQALIEAKKAARQITEDAEKEAKRIMGKAYFDADAIIGNAGRESVKIRDELREEVDALKAYRENILTSLRELGASLNEFLKEGVDTDEDAGGNQPGILRAIQPIGSFNPNGRGTARTG